MKRKTTALLKIMHFPANLILLVATENLASTLGTDRRNCWLRLLYCRTKKHRESWQTARLTFSSSQESCIIGLKIDLT